MALRGSRHAGKNPYGAIVDLAQSGRGADPQGYRAEMIRLIEAERRLSSR